MSAEYGRGQRLLELGSIALFVALSAWGLWRLIAATPKLVRWAQRRWLVLPREYHHWHHTSDEEGIDKNFVGFLPLWDVLFGTAHQPDHWPMNYGTVKFQPPETYLGQLFFPFRRKGKATPYG
jgi:sterol desaturase/sphingolipid hydroxylase (fatty acid hydroxylase superfamily)